jgi:lysophospholipase
MIREGYAMEPALMALPFGMNALTHVDSAIGAIYASADEPRLRVGGPTYHWVREGILAANRFWLALGMMTLTLLIQAGRRTCSG